MRSPSPAPGWTTPAMVAAAVVADLLAWGGSAPTRWGAVAPGGLAIVLLALTYPALACRAARPVSVFALLWVVALTGLVVPAWEPVVGLFIALYAVARHHGRLAWAALLACALPVTANAWNVAGDDGASALAVAAGIWAGLTVIVFAAGRLARGCDARERSLIQAVLDADREARAAERTAISRDVHDIVSHSVSAMTLQARGAHAAHTLTDSDRTEVASSLRAIEEAGVAALTDLQRLLSGLRGGDRQGEGPRLAEVIPLLDQAQRCGVTVDLEVCGETQALDPDVEHTAYRVVQESLTNAVKHAGPGGHARLLFDWQPRWLTIIVTTAAGPQRPTLPSGGSGLAGLAERVRTAGGRFVAEAIPHGFRTEASVPVMVSKEASDDSPRVARRRSGVGAGRPAHAAAG